MPAENFSHLVFDGRFDEVHRPIRDLLLHEIFDPQQNLSTDQKGRLSYERSRFIGQRTVSASTASNDIETLCALAEWPGLCDVAVFSILMVHYNLTVGTIVDRMRKNDVTQRAVAELDAMEAFGPYLATELGYGNNVANLQTTATFDPKTREFILETPDELASKYMSYSGFSDIPKYAVVLARTIIGRDRGVFPFLVQITTQDGPVAGVRTAACPEKPVQGLDNGITIFESVRVSEDCWLSGGLADISADGSFEPVIANPRRRFLSSMSRIYPGRLCVTSSALGASKASLYVALRYSTQRVTTSPGARRRVISDHSSYRLQMYPALAVTYALTAQLNYLKRAYRDDANLETLNAEISATKAVATLESQRTVLTCRERSGAQGIFSVNRIADYLSLIQGLITAEGDSVVLLTTVASQRLETLQSSDADEAPDNELILAVPEYALLARKRDILAEKYRVARADDDESATAFQMLNATAPIAQSYGTAWIMERSVYRLIRAAQSIANHDDRQSILRMAQLVAITEVTRDPIDLVISGDVDAGRLASLMTEASQICDDLHRDVPELIDGFMLTPELLRAPIATDDYAKSFLDCCTPSDARLAAFAE